MNKKKYLTPIKKLTLATLSLYLLGALFSGAIIKIGDMHPPEARPVELEKTYPSSYRVYKNDKLAGLLIGSLHRDLNPIEREAFRKLFIQETTDSISNVFTEIPIIEMLGTTGVEVALANATLYNPNIVQMYFEDLATQHAFLNRDIRIHGRTIFLPFTYNHMTHYPNLCLEISKTVNHYAGVYNTIYDYLTDQKHSKSVATENTNHITLHEMHYNYQKGMNKDLHTLEKNLYCMKERDTLYTEFLNEQSENWIVVIGVYHLAGEESVPKNLEDLGYTLEPFNVHQEAMQRYDEQSQLTT